MFFRFVFYIIFILYSQLWANPITLYVKPDIIYQGSLVILNFENLDDNNSYYIKVNTGKSEYTVPIAGIEHYTTVFIGIPLSTDRYAKIVLYENNTAVLLHNLEIRERIRKISHLKVKRKFARKRFSKALKERLKKEHLLLTEKKKEYIENRMFFNAPEFPVKNGKISSPFGAIRIFNNKRKSVHYGIDIPAVKGTPIHSLFDGRVTLVSNLYYSGNTVIINSGAGLVLLYAHLSKIYVKQGERIRKGEIIGEVGATGRVTGPHLHLGAFIHGVCIDPLSLFKAMK